MNSPLQVLSEYPDDCQPTSIQCLGNAGGLSGAQLWKLQTPRGELCLRRWPAEHPTSKRLGYMHIVAKLATDHGLQFIPRPIVTKDRRSFFAKNDGRLWELTPWMPGQPSLSPGATAAEQQQELLCKAMRSLAEFHNAVADQNVGLVAQGQSQGLKRRATFARELQSGELKQLRHAMTTNSTPFNSQLETIWHLAAPHVERLPAMLAGPITQTFQLQPCLCDIWYDHVLFTGDEVTGIIDFGAVKEDTIAIDLARLLGSVEQHIDDALRIGIEAYSSVRALTSEEQAAIPVFRDSAVVLSGFQWLRWLSLEQRTFENSDGVANRLAAIITSLKNRSSSES